MHSAASILRVPTVLVSVSSEPESCSQCSFHSGYRTQTKGVISVYTRAFHALLPFLSVVSFVYFYFFNQR
jgi:hypothetical protein